MNDKFTVNGSVVSEAIDELLMELGHKVNALEASNAALITAAQWVLRSAGYEKGEASNKLIELRVSRTRLDDLRQAVHDADIAKG